ncbi:F0F1 ATP synthase subunit gamma [Curvivirga sp.]|uniref:F0F1 ATP synthase subunit gamma n=1 Tax=Curvivirga sp. TaxID=2856848 RepID=UPI003B5A3E4D
MPSLKDLRNSIASAQSTRRITSAMKMVAAAKLRKAQSAAEAARPYAEKMEAMLGSLASGAVASNAPKLLAGTGKSDTHLIVVVSSDRGLCGGFNANLVRDVRVKVNALQAEGKTVKLMTIGRKASGQLRSDLGSLFVETYDELSKPEPSFEGADTVVRKITNMFDNDEFDVCTIYYNKFVNALTQEVTPLQLIPFAPADTAGADEATDGAAPYEYEPNEGAILSALLPKNLSVQVFRTMLESFAAEQAARMTAMDNATSNAGDMIDSLTITYNRSRQAQITSELIEIISGAEAL